MNPMIPPELIEKVLAKAQETAAHSWEYSTIFEALLEYRNPKLSIFGDPFPDGKVPELLVADVPALQYVMPFIETLESTTTLCEGLGSSSDPASLGIPALLLSRSPSLQAPLPFRNPYLPAVERQLTELLDNTPRYLNGAISHLSEFSSLWADFIYMAPPLIAYKGVISGDLVLLKESVRQCELYHQVLSMGPGKEYWKHIANLSDLVRGIKKDNGAWCTGNAWAAAGMARVIATMMKSRRFATETKEEQITLAMMVKDILDSAIRADTDDSGLLPNYLDDDSWFGEVAGTALMAATAFRMIVLLPSMFMYAYQHEHDYADWATKKLETIAQHIDPETGIAAPVVNPLIEKQRTPLNGVSSEAQAFIVLCCAAYRAWRDAKDQGVIMRPGVPRSSAC